MIERGGEKVRGDNITHLHSSSLSAKPLASCSPQSASVALWPRHANFSQALYYMHITREIGMEYRISNPLVVRDQCVAL